MCNTGGLYLNGTCVYSCNGKYNGDATVCNGRGVCAEQDKCKCKANYSGNLCQDPFCFGVKGKSFKIPTNQLLTIVCRW
jgi:hypothetical protein